MREGKNKYSSLTADEENKKRVAKTSEGSSEIKRRQREWKGKEHLKTGVAGEIFRRRRPRRF